MNITITKLPSPVLSGDWHDRPLKWVTTGPGTEVQQFATRKEAEGYGRLRRKVGTQLEAIHNFATT